MRTLSYFSYKPEIARRVVGSLAELGIKGYGTTVALSVALSDAETLAGKRDDALHAIPNLVDRYQDAQYVVEHRAEIQAAVDYVSQHAPESEELQATAQQSTETLGEIQTTWDEAEQAWDSLDGDLLNGFGLGDSVDHVGNAWDARPDLGAISDLADAAGSVVPFLDQVQVLIPAVYGGALTLADNFASDERWDTLTVMGGALALAFVLGTLVGFLARRGRPGFVARMLQGWGARVYRGWYVRNLEYALGPELYSAAREHAQHDLLADPEAALDPEAFEELELYFERRALERPSVLSRT